MMFKVILPLHCLIPFPHPTHRSFIIFIGNFHDLFVPAEVINAPLDLLPWPKKKRGALVEVVACCSTSTWDFYRARGVAKPGKSSKCEYRRFIKKSPFQKKTI